jgi:Xaa-Pro aminopeptidase
MDTDALDAYLDSKDRDGYLIDADSEDADQRYLSGYDAPDPFLTLYTPENLWVLVSGLEYGRAKTESNADVVRRFADYDFQQMREEHGAEEARRRMVAAFLEEAGVDAVAAPKRFPLETADGLRERGVTVEPDADDTITTIRARKTDAEIEYVRAAQRANEAALSAAEDRLAAAEPVDGTLHHDGEALTAERVKEEIEVALLRAGCALEETIVAGGKQGADPHERGSGPLPADEPIVIDAFPRDTETKYHADMTRTFVPARRARRYAGATSSRSRRWRRRSTRSNRASPAKRFTVPSVTSTKRPATRRSGRTPRRTPGSSTRRVTASDWTSTNSRTSPPAGRNWSRGT